VLLDSVFMRFAHEGRGTLAPVDPPRFVVRGGLYRIVRNPMYLANLAAIVGSGLFFQSWRLLVWAGALFAAFHLFVVVYEEPTLRRRFGEVYESYQRDVGRWVPRVRQSAGDQGDKADRTDPSHPASTSRRDPCWRSPAGSGRSRR
jgi:protein-S-isoprenylcysteine O-methyltransferase Ste14